MKSMAVCTVAAVSLMWCLATPGVAQNYQPGDRVVIVAEELPRRGGTMEADSVYPGQVFVVGKVVRNQLWAANGIPGWIDQRLVIPFDANALAYMTEKIRTQPRNALYHFGRGRLLMEVGNLDESYKDLTNALELAPLYHCYLARATLLAQKREYALAIEDLDKSIAMDASQPDGYVHRAGVYTALAEYDKAIEDCTTALKLDAKVAIAYCGRGYCWLAKGELEKANADCLQALRISPTYHAAHLLSAQVREAGGLYPQALTEYRAAAELNPTDPNTLNTLAWFCATCPDDKCRNAQFAIACATQACELTQWKSAEIIDTLAAAHAEAKDFAKAIEYTEKAMQLTDDIQVKATLSEHLESYRAGTPIRTERKQN